MAAIAGIAEAIAVTARSPNGCGAAGQEERRPQERHHHADGNVADEAGAEICRRQERRPGDGGDRQDAVGGRADEQAHDVGYDEADEADQAADRDSGRGRHRRQRERTPRSRLTSIPRWPAAASPRSIPSSERPRAMISTDEPMISGAATTSRTHDEPPSPPSRNEKIWRSSTPETYIAMVNTAARTEPTA